jgi:UDP:flavonoid glycosyltransferase YjiC (YdhE family)
MAHILFATWDGGGNVPPAVGIATELKARGHAVRFLGHETQRESISAAGFDFEPFATADPFSSTDRNSPARMMALFSDKAVGRDTVAEAARTATDVVVVDCMLIGALRACADAGITYVSLEHLFDGYLRGAWLKGPIGLAARAKRLRPRNAWDSAALTVVASVGELDPGHGAAHTATTLWTGPVLDPPAPHDLASHDPAVLISLSTYNFPGMATSLQTLLDATAGIDARVVVTTGPVIDPSELRPAANHEVHRFVPHDELMPEMTLVVGHGGHATTMRALAHDLPLLVMPMHPMLDQPLVGRRVQAAGAGRLVKKSASAERLRPVIADLLADGPHRTSAARLGALIRESRGTTTAADRILEVVPNGARPASQLG